MPSGFVARLYRHDEDLPILVDLVRDAFSDHYGHIEQSFERDLDLFRHWFDGSPYFDPNRVMLAMDEATAHCGRQRASADRAPPPTRRRLHRYGWRTASLSAARLGLSDAETQFRRLLGPRDYLVCLEVDGESLTNALALYERVGMRVHHSFVTYEKLLRDGVELAKVALD